MRPPSAVEGDTNRSFDAKQRGDAFRPTPFAGPGHTPARAPPVRRNFCMPKWSKRTRVIAISAAVIVTLGGVFVGTNREWLGLEHEPGVGLPMQPRERAEMIAGGNPAEAGAEAFEASTIADQFAQARLAPGIVAPGAYG